MNQNHVVSAVAAADLTGKEYYQVKLTTTGVDVCGTGSVPIGTLLRATPHQEDGVYVGKAVAVQLKAASIHFAVIGASSAAVARAAGLILDTNSENAGKLVPSESSPIARAWDAFTATDGLIVQIYYL